MKRSTPDTANLRPKTLDPVRPNTGIERAYRRRLQKLIDEMHRSIVYWISAAYRRRPPEAHRMRAELAQDVSPARTLQMEAQRLARQWQKRFDVLARDLATHFAQQVSGRSDAALTAALKRSGIAVKFTTTRAVNDVLQATIAENVSLIKSIPEQHLRAVEGAVMRSVQRGRDLASLVKDLEDRFQITRRRAAFIARDQNNKATAMITHTRQAELGIREAVWVHSGGGKHPRPTHLKAGRDKVRYDITIGWFDPHEQKHILPGELIQCRCVSRPIINGLT